MVAWLRTENEASLLLPMRMEITFMPELSNRNCNKIYTEITGRSRAFLRSDQSFLLPVPSPFYLPLPPWGTNAAAPTPFRPGNPALCGSCPLVTPYYCTLGDLLCFVFMSAYCMFDLSVYYIFVSSVLWHCWLGLLTCKNRLPYYYYYYYYYY